MLIDPGNLHYFTVKALKIAICLVLKDEAGSCKPISWEQIIYARFVRSDVTEALEEHGQTLMKLIINP